MVLMHHHRDMGKLGHGRLHQCAEERRSSVLSCAGTRLHDHRRVGLIRRLHDGARLLKIVDIECRHAVTVLGGMVQ